LPSPRTPRLGGYPFALRPSHFCAHVPILPPPKKTGGAIIAPILNPKCLQEKETIKKREFYALKVLGNQPSDGMLPSLTEASSFLDAILPV
jgi:hypothetical protein